MKQEVEGDREGGEVGIKKKTAVKWREGGGRGLLMVDLAPGKMHQRSICCLDQLGD